MIIVGGIIPYFFADNFYSILATRCVVGAGVGLVLPLGNTIVMLLFKGSGNEPKMLGLGTAFMNLGGVLFQLLAGVVNPATWELIIEKFWKCTKFSAVDLGEEKYNRIIEICRNLENETDMRELVNALVP